MTNENALEIFLDLLKNNSLDEKTKLGFKWDIEHYSKDEILKDKSEQLNIVPNEGLNYLLNRFFNKGTVVSNWYIGLFSGNYTPVNTDTAATFPGNATEFTGYSETTRQELIVPASLTGTSTDNSASPAIFTITSNATVYGGFLVSASAKSATTGILGSALKFTTSKPVEARDTLRVTLTLTLVSNS